MAKLYIFKVVVDVCGDFENSALLLKLLFSSSSSPKTKTLVDLSHVFKLVEALCDSSFRNVATAVRQNGN